MDLGIAGHTVLVTGGGRGLGREICSAFAQEGAFVGVLDRDLAPAQEVAGAIRNAGGGALALQADVTDRGDVARAVEHLMKERAGVQILVNNAGFSMDGPLHEMSDEQWDSVVDVCLKGTFLVTRAVLPHMRDRRYGRIVNISSRAHLGDFNKTNYAAAKAGVVGFTSALALEVGPQGITVNAVAPGFFETERVKTLKYGDDIRRRSMERAPVRRLGVPRELANGVLYLSAASSGFVTGTVLYVTGGRFHSS